jgi:hypothetical protein
VIWVIAIAVVLLALITVAWRRIKRDPSYDGATRGRIDDHQVQRTGENMHDRFGGGPI